LGASSLRGSSGIRDNDVLCNSPDFAMAGGVAAADGVAGELTAYAADGVARGALAAPNCAVAGVPADAIDGSPAGVAAGVTAATSPAVPMRLPEVVTVASTRAVRMGVSAVVAASPAAPGEGVWTAEPPCNRAREIPPADLADLVCP
jgi:hypothetical protein